MSILKQAALDILQELMQQMASVEYTENVTDDQLEALAGGEALRYQASAFGVTKNNKVYPIFVGLSQERQ